MAKMACTKWTYSGWMPNFWRVWLFLRYRSDVYFILIITLCASWLILQSNSPKADQLSLILLQLSLRGKMTRATSNHTSHQFKYQLYIVPHNSCQELPPLFYWMFQLSLSAKKIQSIVMSANHTSSVNLSIIMLSVRIVSSSVHTR